MKLIVIISIFHWNKYIYFEILTFSCRCACCCGGSGCCCCGTGRSGSEFSDASIRSAAITLIKHVWKFIISSSSVPREYILVKSWNIWRSPAFYGYFCRSFLKTSVELMGVIRRTLKPKGRQRWFFFLLSFLTKTTGGWGCQGSSKYFHYLKV